MRRTNSYGTLDDGEDQSPNVDAGSSNDISLDFIESHLANISKCGIYQALFALTVQYAAIFACFNYTIMSWGGLTPELTCESEKNITKYCDVLEHCANYTQHPVFHSLVQDWDLTTCFTDVAHTFDVRRFLTTMQAIGFTVGGIISGPIADKYGRKWVVFFGNLVMLGLGLGSAFAPNWHVLAGLLFVMSLSRSLTAMPQIVQGVESTTKRYRLAITIASQWEIAYVLAALFAYLTHDWSAYILYTSIICLPIVLLLLFFGESPRWLVQTGQFGKAADVLNLIAKVNRSKLRVTGSEISLAYAERIHPESSAFSIIEFFRSLINHLRLILTSKHLLSLLAFAIVIRMTNSIIDVSFQFNLNDFITNPFISIGAYGIIRIWCPVLAVFLDIRYQWFSRRLYALSSLVLMACLNIGAVISAILMKRQNSTPHLTMTIFFILTDVINNGLLYSAVTQVVAEAYPTTMRNTALSILSIAAGIGEVLGNLLLQLQPFWHPSPYVLVEGLLVFSTIVGLFVIPETKDKVLPDS